MDDRFKILLGVVAVVLLAGCAGLAGGADTVGRISFGLSPEREENLREEALGDAMDNARDDATVLADNAGLEVGSVVTVSTANARVRGHSARYTADVAEESAGDAATGIQTGDVDVTVQVRVVYEATETE